MKDLTHRARQVKKEEEEEEKKKKIIGAKNVPKRCQNTLFRGCT
jgi:hypothetical protein